MNGGEPRPRVLLPGGRRVGPHLQLNAGLVRAAERTAAIGGSALQIFTDNPTAWRRRADLPPELPAFRRRLAELDVSPLAVHAAYLINLAGPDPLFFARSIEVLARELWVSAAFGARYVNVHLGSHRGAGFEAGVERLVEGLTAALGAADGASPMPRIVLENSAGGGFGLGVTVAELAAIDRAVTAAGLGGAVAYCLDTAHLWAAGYDISTAAGVDALLADFADRVGLERLAMIHLNDSRAALGSRQDRHEHVAAGAIGATGLARLLLHPGLDHVAFLVEAPGSEDGYDAVNLERIDALAAGREPPPFPAPSDSARGSSGRGAGRGSEVAGAAERSQQR